MKKVAKVRALRETFIENLSGMYEAEEMQLELPREEITIDQTDAEPQEVNMDDL